MPAIGARISMQSAKGLFFDSKQVTDALDDAERYALSRFGFFTRQDAKQNIKNRPIVDHYKLEHGFFTKTGSGPQTSRPGEGPTNQMGLLKGNLFFGYDVTKSSVVAGPIKLFGFKVADIPKTLEEGGTAKFWHSRENRFITYQMRPRPYMGPAFARQLTKLDDYWRDAMLKAGKG